MTTESSRRLLAHAGFAGSREPSRAQHRIQVAPVGPGADTDPNGFFSLAFCVFLEIAPGLPTAPQRPQTGQIRLVPQV